MDQLYPKKGGERFLLFFSLPKVGAHNRVPSKQFYYWVAEPLIVSLINEKGSDEKKTIVNKNKIINKT